MSLFEATDFCSICTSSTDETNVLCGDKCLLAADVDEDGYDELIVGNYSGYVSIYRIRYEQKNNIGDDDTSLFKPSDRMLEIQLQNPVLQLLVGKFVSGSTSPHLCVLHPRCVAVYGFISTVGSAGHGDQFELRLVYEHALSHSTYQLVSGRFGGVRKRDFFAAIGLDGTMAIFEQESPLCKIPPMTDFIVPSPFVYVQYADLFVTLNSDYCLVAYTYETLVKITTGQKSNFVWSYNLGEIVLDIRTIVNNKEPDKQYLVIVSERNLTCLTGADGRLHFVKRLQYAVLCCFSFFNETSDKIMTLLSSESGVLFIYEETRLCWSSTLPEIPIAICRANFKNLNGCLVTLSECGNIKCCYLGTEPSLFVAPPSGVATKKYERVAQKYQEIRQKLRSRQLNNSDEVVPMVVGDPKSNERQIRANMRITYDQEIAKNHSDIDPQCKVELNLANGVTLSHVVIAFDLQLPFFADPPSYNIQTLCENTTVCARIGILIDSNGITLSPSSLCVRALVTYHPHEKQIIRANCRIPARFIFIIYKQPSLDPTMTPPLKLTVNLEEPSAPLTIIFSEFVDENWSNAGCTDELANFAICWPNLNDDKYSMFISINLSNQNRLLILSYSPAECLPFVCSMIDEFFDRNNRIRNNRQTIKNKRHNRVNRSIINRPIIDRPIIELFSVIDKHALLIDDIQLMRSNLQTLTAQYRLIERRMLIKLKDDKLESVPAANLLLLYKDVHQNVIRTTHQIQQKQQELMKIICVLYANIDTILYLFNLSSSSSSSSIDYNLLRCALIPSNTWTLNQSWEERVEVALNYIVQKEVGDDQFYQVIARDHDQNQHRISERIKNLLRQIFTIATPETFIENEDDD